ncbi:valine--tRNA ligase [Myxococcota bacterium]|nr:valine--tRNA ligase [Myxococcota bacterium]MBU1411991.1 valine--tRNA ligase [Myxococcota bacterium]MBU1508859.1 valine--tRNA ligase [Myxococcota bacterium]
MQKTYSPLEFEQQIYTWWESAGFFRAQDSSDKPPYCIVIPPPNVTGALHMGHALTNTIQDILIRWRRMQGHNTLWLPGTDHAGIATQAVVERELRREGTTRHELGREKFLERVWVWKEKYGSRITTQLRRLGSSLDWERERFTMDEGLTRAVLETFVRLHEEKLIYRDRRLINWCTSCRTALSNLEVEHESHEGKFWHLRYPLVDAAGTPGEESIEVATTRPETMLGDTAVAVHPDPEGELRSRLHKLEAENCRNPQELQERDEAVAALHGILEGPRLAELKRLAGLIGRRVLLPLTGRTIPVVGDVHADPAFGTGAVKITPGHDFNDFEVGRRHGLEIINILNPDGTLNENAGKFAGMTVPASRTAVERELDEGGYLVKVVEHSLDVGHCSRCDTVVEPFLSLQWFVKVAPLAASAMEAVRSGKTQIIPPMWEKVYFHWMENLEDWCISRQLWWGHQIPAWFCEHGHVTVARSTPDVCCECGSRDLTRDPDVLDTWFSSALWPFSTLGWPDKTPQLATFYPNAVMETGFDILFFWVARMLMMGTHLLGETPFEKVFLHALVRDADGRKMSKSLGNTIDPLDAIEGISLEDLIKKVEAGLPPEAEREDRRRRILDGVAKKYPEGIEVHGTDALRFTLAVLAAQGRDIKLDISRISGFRAFCNKIWQAIGGVVLPHLPQDPTPVTDPAGLSLPDRWILSRLAQTVAAVNPALEEFRLNDAAMAIYQFVWHEVCDWYLEMSKGALYGRAGEERQEGASRVLLTVIETSLRLLHPFMPFLTEKLWQELPRRAGDPESIMVALYPKAGDFTVDEVAEHDMIQLQEIISTVRTIRGENNLPPSAELSLKLHMTDPVAAARIAGLKDYVCSNLTRIKDLEFVEARPPVCASCPVAGGEAFVPLTGLVNFEEEIARQKKALAVAQKDLSAVQAKMSNPRFTANAPAEVVEENRRRLEDNAARVDKITLSLAHFEELAKGQG